MLLSYKVDVLSVIKLGTYKYVLYKGMSLLPRAKRAIIKPLGLNHIKNPPEGDR